MHDLSRWWLAAGAHSQGLLQSLGISAPLISERGYHLEYEATLSINRPVCSIAHGFYVSPMTGRIRVAGTVELGAYQRHRLLPLGGNRPNDAGVVPSLPSA